MVGNFRHRLVRSICYKLYIYIYNNYIAQRWIPAVCQFHHKIKKMRMLHLLTLAGWPTKFTRYKMHGKTRYQPLSKKVCLSKNGNLAGKNNCQIGGFWKAKGLSVQRMARAVLGNYGTTYNLQDRTSNTRWVLERVASRCCKRPGRFESEKVKMKLMNQNRDLTWTKNDGFK